MAITYFNLTDGALEFDDDKLIIFDKAKRNRTGFILIMISSLLYSISTTIKGYRHHDNEDFWFGLVLTLMWISVTILRRKELQKVENEILLSNINQVSLSIEKFEGNIVAKILTKNGLQRKIKIVQENNQDFVFRNLLIEHQISVD